MNQWITPKTDWVDGEFFNLTPDYERIRGNILFAQEYAKRLYESFSLQQMKDFTIEDIPFADFFNNIVENVRALENYLFVPPGIEPLKNYTENQPAWNAEQLNDIERNLLLLYNAMQDQWEHLKVLSFTLGGEDFE